jgi:hypothetical protein
MPDMIATTDAPRFSVLVMPQLLDLTDCWFDWTGRVSRLRIATDQTGLPLEFVCPVSFLGGQPLRFVHVADIKGRRIYEASEPRPEDGEARSEQVPSSLIEGPLREGSRDVS